MKLKDLLESKLTLDKILKIKDRDKLDEYLFDVAAFTASSTGLKTWVNVAVLVQQSKVVLQVSNTTGPFNWSSYFLISVDEEPKILTPSAVKLEKEDIKSYISWIRINCEHLKKIGQTYFNNDSWIKTSKKLIKLTESAMLLEMSTLQPEDTGINYPMKLIKVGGKHGFRVKVSNTVNWNTTDNFSVSISDNPEIMTGTSKIDVEDYKKIYSWIRLNVVVLREIEKVFNTGGLNMQDLLDQLRPYKKRIPKKKTK